MILPLLLLSPTVQQGVVFSRPAPGVEVRMDVHQPEGEGPFPAVVVIHGGAYVMGDRTGFGRVARLFSRAGFVVANVDYRLAPRFKMGDMFADVQTAVRFVRAHAAEWRVDPARIGAMGHSAGGQLALMLGVLPEPVAPKEWPGVSSRVGAVWSFAGPTDFSLPFPEFDKNLVAPMVFGKPLKEAGDLMRDTSPITYAREMPPAFLMWGTADTTVLPEQSERLAAAMRADGRTVETRAIPGLGHSSDFSRPDFREAYAAGVHFLRRELRRQSSSVQ